MGRLLVNVLILTLLWANCFAQTTTDSSKTDSSSTSSSSSWIVSAISLVGAGGSAVWGWWANKQAKKEMLEQRKLLAKMDDEREKEKREEQEDRNLRSLMNYYANPIALAGFDLQSRLSTMLGNPPVSNPLLYTMTHSNDDQQKDYAIFHTMFLFGEFLAWLEVLRKEAHGFKLSAHEFTCVWKCDCGWQGVSYHDCKAHKDKFSSNKLKQAEAKLLHNMRVVWMCGSCDWEGNSIHQAIRHQKAMAHKCEVVYMCDDPTCSFQGTETREEFDKHAKGHKPTEIWHCSGCGWQTLDKETHMTEKGDVLCPQAQDPQLINNIIDAVKFQLSGNSGIQRGVQEFSETCMGDSNEDLFQLLAGEQREIGEVMTEFDYADRDGRSETMYRVIGYSEFLQRMKEKDSHQNAPIQRAFKKLQANLEQFATLPKPPRHRVVILQTLICKLIEGIDPNGELLKQKRAKPAALICAHCEHPNSDHMEAEGKKWRGGGKCTQDGCLCTKSSCAKQAEYLYEIDKNSTYVKIEANKGAKDVAGIYKGTPQPDSTIPRPPPSMPVLGSLTASMVKSEKEKGAPSSNLWQHATERVVAREEASAATSSGGFTDVRVRGDIENPVVVRPTQLPGQTSETL